MPLSIKTFDISAIVIKTLSIKLLKQAALSVLSFSTMKHSIMTLRITLNHTPFYYYTMLSGTGLNGIVVIRVSPVQIPSTFFRNPVVLRRWKAPKPFARPRPGRRQPRCDIRLELFQLFSITFLLPDQAVRWRYKL
jgi:hypothetical protein